MMVPPPPPEHLKDCVRQEHLPVMPPVVEIHPHDTPPPRVVAPPDPMRPSRHTLPVHDHDSCPGAGCQYYGVLPQLPLEVYVPIAHQMIYTVPWTFEASAFQARGVDGLYVPTHMASTSQQGRCVRGRGASSANNAVLPFSPMAGTTQTTTGKTLSAATGGGWWHSRGCSPSLRRYLAEMRRG